MKKRKVLISLGSPSEICWLGDNYEPTRDINSADFVLFTGGEDINPRIYGQKVHPTTHFSFQRDEYEISLFNQAVARKIPKIGICRGAQLITALSGGELWQNVRHPSYHKIKTIYGTELTSNSLHHQMAKLDKMNPADYKLIAWADNVSKIKEDGNGVFSQEGYKEPEMVYFKNTDAFVMQYHPEFAPQSEFAKFSKTEFEKIYPAE